MSDYPSDDELKKIETWEGDFHELMSFIESIWWARDWGFSKEREVYFLSTGGWSGNEDIIRSFQKNFIMWSQYWYSTRCGGHYIFKHGSNESGYLKWVKSKKETPPKPSPE